MSGKNLELSLIMRLRDLASGEFTRAQRDIQSGIAKTQKANDGLTRSVAQYKKTRAGAAVLGMRSEREIQREIQRTEAAYNRLSRSGTMSMREQARAADATRRRVHELNNEMGKFTLGQKAMRGLQNGAAVAGGLTAGAYVLGKPIGQTMDYGMRLAQMSNTAFTDRNTTGRIAGKRELNSAIVNAVRIGGGTRESAADTLDGLIASGAMSGKDAMGMLPTLTKAATASGADSSELAQIGIRGMQSMGIKPGEMGKIIDMAITAGQAGGFELKDMAKWLPAQMAAAKTSGISGISGVAKLLAANQAAKITAGSSDEAGNNLVNLLTKINSRDTAKDAKSLGIDLSGTLAAARGKGVDSLDAFVGVVDSVVAKNSEFQALQAKLKTASGADRQATLSSQADILQGSAIGQIVQDRQALMALVGIMGNRDYMTAVQQKTLNGAGATDSNFAMISREAGFKTQQAMNEKTFATQTAFENLTPLLGSLASGFSDLAREYPNLTAATIAATTALTALAVTALGMAGLSALMGGEKGAAGGVLGGAMKKGAGGLGRGAMAASGALFSTAGMGISAAGAAGYGVGSLLSKYVLEGTAANDKLGEGIARMMDLFGSQEAQQALEINLHLDGEKITQVVTGKIDRTARRS